MPEFIETFLAVIVIGGSLIGSVVIVFLVCMVVQNTKFYENWQRKLRERRAKKFMESLKK